MRTKSHAAKGIAAVTTLLVILVIGASGCKPARKILPPPGPAPRMAPAPQTSRNPAITAEENNGLNNKLTNAVKRLRNVRKASVLVIGTSAYVGLDVSPGTTKARLEALRWEAATAVKRTDPRIRNVWTATHAKTFHRIERVRADIRAGKPSSTYANEVTAIINESDIVR